ncbi:MAG: MATE family efflux transporter [Desulfobacterales bacterium]|nr:MATE family efflux transporter [Desulfobacterales bacterium]
MTRLLHEFKQSGFLKLLVTLALPIALQNMFTSTMTLVDLLMVGQLNEAAVASVGIANQFVFIFIVIQYGIHSGIAVFTAQYWGKKDLSRLKQLSGLGIGWGMLLAIPAAVMAVGFPEAVMGFFSKDPEVVAAGSAYLSTVGMVFPLATVVLSYVSNLRAMNVVKIPLYVTMLGVSLNITLNYLLIFGKMGLPALGVQGAALGTCISKFVEAGILITIVHVKKYPLAATFREMKALDKAFCRRVFTTCWPVFLNEFFWVTGVRMYNLVYARMGTSSIAAVNIMASIEEVMFIPFFGFFHGGSIMIGNSIGASKPDQAFAIGKGLLAFQFIMALCVGLAMIQFREFILSFYNLSAAAHTNALNLLLVSGLIFWAKTTNFTNVVSVLRGGGDTRFGFFLDLAGVWCIGVPMAFIGAFIFKLPVYWVMPMVAVEEVFKLGLGIPRFLGRKWIRDLVNG